MAPKAPPCRRSKEAFGGKMAKQRKQQDVQILQVKYMQECRSCLCVLQFNAASIIYSSLAVLQEKQSNLRTAAATDKDCNPFDFTAASPTNSSNEKEPDWLMTNTGKKVLSFCFHCGPVIFNSARH